MSRDIATKSNVPTVHCPAFSTLIFANKRSSDHGTKHTSASFWLSYMTPRWYALVASKSIRSLIPDVISIGHITSSIFSRCTVTTRNLYDARTDWALELPLSLVSGKSIAGGGRISEVLGESGGVTRAKDEDVERAGELTREERAEGVFSSCQRDSVWRTGE